MTPFGHHCLSPPRAATASVASAATAGLFLRGGQMSSNVRDQSEEDADGLCHGARCPLGGHRGPARLARGEMGRGRNAAGAAGEYRQILAINPEYREAQRRLQALKRSAK